MSIRKKLLLTAVALFVLAILLSVTILPGIIKSKATEWVASETGRTLEIESVSINPFSLSIELRGLNLSNSDHRKTFISWQRLRVSLSINSAFRRAPIIDELILENPEINLVRTGPETFNFSDLIPEKTDDDTEQKSSEPFRFAVANIAITNGMVDLIDNSLDEPVHHRIEDLKLLLPSIGNLPHMVESHAQPQISAVINDSPFNVQGAMKPFTDIQEMSFDIILENIDLPHYLGYVPGKLPVEVRNGKLNLDLDLTYRILPETGSELELSGKADLVSLDIYDRMQEKLFFLPLLQVDLAPSRPLEPEIHLASLRAYNLEVQLNRNQQGKWNHARMAASDNLPAQPPQQGPEENAEPSSPFKLTIDDIDIRDAVVYFEDKLPAGGFQTVARDINIDVSDFTPGSETGIPVTLSLHTDREETINVKGNFQLSPLTLSLHNDFDNVVLGAYKPYYQQFYKAPLGGTLSLDADLTINPEQPLLINNGQLSLLDLKVEFNENEGVHGRQLLATDFSYDMKQNRVDIGSVSSTATNIDVSRNNTGDWSFMSDNFPVLVNSAENSEKKQAAATDSGKPEFSFRLHDLNIANWGLRFKDSMPAEPAFIKVNNLALQMQNLSWPDKSVSPMDLSADLVPGGNVSIAGDVVLAEQSASLSANIREIPLKTIGPYVSEYTNIVLTDGRLNAQLGTRISAGDDLKLDFKGKAGINRMHLLDGTHREDLLKWDSLQLAEIEGELDPLVLTIDSVTLSDYFARVLIDEQARINLVNAFRKEPAEEGDKTPPEEDVTVSEKAQHDETEPSSHDIRVDKVVLQGGRVDFTDRNLPQPFHADMTELGGRIDGLSSHPGTQATVDLRGSLRNQSPLTISGQINPLAEDVFLDVDLNFNDIEMTPFSPYAGNYVGFLIEKGKLNLSLDYLIEDNQLKATNKVFLDQFDFGSAVESENATSLPVKLAVALLKDGNGEIHLDIPVYGSLDDPQFSITSVVWTVIKNLLIKAATSPFALLGALGGGGEEDFRLISFTYGSSRLSASEQDKLLRMAEALQDRPSLDVEISGFIDPEEDPEGYRKELLAAKVRRLKYLDLVDDGTLPEGTLEQDVVVPPEEYADYLWDVYKDEDFPKPRNFIGMTKKLPEGEMEKLIYTNTDVTENDLADLAQARALVVQNFLIETGGLAKERIFLKKPDIHKAPEEATDVRARVELGATVR